MEEEGVWVDFGQGLEVKIRRSDSRRSREVFRRLYKPYRKMEEAGNAIPHDDEILIKLDSVENYPYEEKDKVRGFIDNSSILLKSSKKDEFKTTVTIKMNISPGGWLPLWLLKLHTDSWTKELFKNLREDIQGYLKEKEKSKGTPSQQTQAAPE